jgi:hypothetical protein
MLRRTPALGAALTAALTLLSAIPLLALSGCGARSGASPPTEADGHVTEETWLRYRGDLVETAALVAQYVRHRERNDKWPEPGTYNTKALIYKGTETGGPAFPNRRRDFYRTLFDGGRELDVILHDDGRMEIDVLWDREPERAGE